MYDNTYNWSFSERAIRIQGNGETRACSGNGILKGRKKLLRIHGKDGGENGAA